MTVNNDVIFILASASLRRQQILSITGLNFSIANPDIDESKYQNKNTSRLAEQIACEKACKIASQTTQPSVIISADTLIQLGKNILGKPADLLQAKEMLTRLSGRSHEVITGICINFQPSNIRISRSLITRVYFKSLSEDTIDEYILRNNTLDWAGGYAIQGTASMFVQKIEGDYFNVVGLPLSLLYDMLLEIGYDLLNNRWIIG